MISPLQKNLPTRGTPASLRGGVISCDRVIQQIAKSLAPSVKGLLLAMAPLATVFWALAIFSAIAMLTVWLVRA